MTTVGFTEIFVVKDNQYRNTIFMQLLSANKMVLIN